MNATAMNASQPKIAVFLWLALQRPIRAATFRERLVSPGLESDCPFVAGSSGSFWMMRVFITAPWDDCGTCSSSQPASSGRRRATGRSWGRVSGVREGACASAAQEHQHGQDAPRLTAGRGQTELAEDAGDVLLDSTQRDHELVRDPLIRAAGRHQLEHLALARGQLRERIIGTLT